MPKFYTLCFPAPNEDKEVNIYEHDLERHLKLGYTVKAEEKPKAEKSESKKAASKKAPKKKATKNEDSEKSQSSSEE